MKNQRLHTIIKGVSYPAWVSGLSNLDAFRTAATAGAVGVITAGDSIGAGVGATNPATEGFVTLLEAYLKTKYGDAGTRYAADNAGFSTTGSWSLTSWELDGANHCRQGASSATITITLTGRYFDIHYATGGATAAFTVALDGGAPASVGGSSGGLEYHVHTVDATTNAEHTVVITAPATASPCIIRGVVLRNGNNGIWNWNASVSAYSIDEYTVSSHQNALNSLAPKLVIIPLTVNDCVSQTALSTYQTEMEKLITAAKNNGASVLLVSENTYTTNEGRTIPQSQYRDRMLTIATAQGCAFIDILAKWGGTAAAGEALGFQTANNVHPNTAGHADYFAAISPYL